MAAATSTSPLRVPIPHRGVDYRGKVVLAPMVRSGELPTRLLALKYGADLVWGPETVDRALIGTTPTLNPHTECIDFLRYPSHPPKGSSSHLQRPSTIFSTHPSETSRLIYQMGTADPVRAVSAGTLVAPYVSGIDVNSGCPKPFSTSGGMGAALLRTPDLLCSILSALVAEVGVKFGIGISVKIRILEKPEETEALIRKLCATGITGLTVHCRTTPMRPRERAIREQLPMIASICREAGVAILMNGDVTSRSHALSLMPEYGVDGAMIATSAEANPSCFRLPEEGGLASWQEITRAYMEFALQVENKWGNTKFMLNHFISGKTSIGRDLSGKRAEEGYKGLCVLLGYTDLMDKADEVDLRLGLGEKQAQARRASNKETVLAAAGRLGRSMGGNASKRRSLAERGAGHVIQPLAMNM